MSEGAGDGGDESDNVCVPILFTKSNNCSVFVIVKSFYFDSTMPFRTISEVHWTCFVPKVNGKHQICIYQCFGEFVCSVYTHDMILNLKKMDRTNGHVGLS